MLKSCLILGSGRSGTSLLAGLFRNAGYFMGADLINASQSNPKGYFEDKEINDINEALLAPVVPRRPPVLGRWMFRNRLAWGWRWLARLPIGTEIPSTRREVERIRMVTDKRPFCFKDPRFSFTLPVWRPHLGDAVFLCVFRHPAATVNSILRETQVAPYLKHLEFSREDALDVWLQNYLHIVEVHRREGEWMFVHYDQIVSGEALPGLTRFTGAQLDHGFPDRALSRSREEISVPVEALDTYRRLCELAGFDPDDSR